MGPITEDTPSARESLVGWLDIHRAWDSVEADMLELFGVDMWGDGAWNMPWPRLGSLINGVLTTPPNRVLVPMDGQFALQDVPRTRTQHQLFYTS